MRRPGLGVEKGLGAGGSGRWSRSWCFRDRTAGKLVKMSKGVRGGGRRGTVQSIAAGTKCKAEKSDCSWGRGVVVIKSD